MFDSFYTKKNMWPQCDCPLISLQLCSEILTEATRKKGNVSVPWFYFMQTKSDSTSVYVELSAIPLSAVCFCFLFYFLWSTSVVYYHLILCRAASILIVQYCTGPGLYDNYLVLLSAAMNENSHCLCKTKKNLLPVNMSTRFELQNLTPAFPCSPAPPQLPPTLSS